MLPIIDAHLDMAWNALSYDREQTYPLDRINARESEMRDIPSRQSACVSIPAMREANIPICVTTVLARAKTDAPPQNGYRRVDLDFATQQIAHAMAHGQLAYYRVLERQGHMLQLRTAGQLRQHWNSWLDAPADERARHALGYVLSMEGADPITEPEEMHDWFERGLRSVILAHYGRGHYADGTGGTAGLTEKGRRLIEVMEPLGIMLDLTHSTDKSFDEVYDSYSGPVMASHTNCRALVPGDRQFTDDQILRLVQRGAVIGVALDAWMLVPDWQRGVSTTEQVTMRDVARHIDHMCQLIGNANHVAIGSDLDGGYGAEQRPNDLHCIGDLHKLESLLRELGYSSEDIEGIFYQNWLDYFSRNLPA